MHRGKVVHTVILPIALLVVVAMAVVVGFVWFSANTQDEIARKNSIVSVAAALDRHATHLGRIAKDFAWWNDAVENLILDLDQDWADQGIGFYAFENYGYERSFVLDGENRTVYSSDNAVRVDDQALTVLRPGLEVLLEQARALAEDKPEPVTGIVETADGSILLVGVSAIAPEEGAPFELPGGPKFLLIFTKELNQELLDSIGGALPLEGLHRTMAGGASAEQGVLPLVAPDGTTLATLVWQPHKPGQQFLTSVTPALGIAIVLIGAFTYAVLRHAREATGAIEASEARFRDVADASSDWIWEVDGGLRLTFISERYALVTGKPPEASVGMPLAELFHAGENLERWRQFLEDLERWRPFRNIVSLCEDAQGIHRTVRLSGKPVFHTTGRPIGYRGTATDITTEIEAGRRAEYLAMHDALTQLPNRVLLLERLDQAIASVSRRRDMAALLLLDLDRFKDVNDTLGHPAGDLVLKEVAARLSACVREVDTVARIGGDEFAIVQVGINDAAEAQQLSRRVLDLFQTPLELDGHDALVTASIGVALIPTDASVPSKLLQLADIALYRAKEDGRNATRFFEPEMDARLQRRKAIERELRLALTRDQLELYYQPKISLLNDELAGVEALVRWRHPERGLVLPGEFIGIAEETGLILQLGEWVLRTATRQASRWRDIQVSVNLSPAQFRQPDLVDVVASALGESGLAPHRLELEITESVLIQQPDAAAKLLDDLKTLGVRVAMDDFGTGYSSLSYLQRFHFDKIKVDRSFIGAIGIEPSAAAIVRAVINLASSLGMLTCAEGVETDEQLAALRDEGCSEVQGYLFGKPMPAREFEVIYGAQRHARLAPSTLAEAVGGG
jgi:diguanylate cyclase (GGDEF)-like protein/PAS domain S-box-containing protein